MSETITHSVAAEMEVAPRSLRDRLATDFARCTFLWQRSVRRQLFSRQTLVALLLAALCGLIVLAWSQRREPTTKRFAEEMLIPTYVAFLIPILAICYGASSIGGEREDGTLVYLLIASIPRPLVYAVKFVASLTLASCLAAAILALLCLLGGPFGREAWRIFWPASLLGVMTYTALFLFLGAVFRHGTVIALAYWFFLEVVMGNLPGIINRVSIAFYVRCLVYAAGSNHQIQPLGEEMRNQFRPIPGPTAALFLAALIAAFFLAGVVMFWRKEYRDVS